MCNPGPYFKFCTCSPEQLGETYWKLSRGSTFETVNYVGSIAPPLDAGTDYFFSLNDINHLILGFHTVRSVQFRCINT